MTTNDGDEDEDEDDGNGVLSARRHAAYCSVDCSALVSRRRAARPAMRRALHLRNDREPVRRPPAAACLPACLPGCLPFLEEEEREERKVVRARGGRSALADSTALVRAFVARIEIGFALVSASRIARLDRYS